MGCGWIEILLGITKQEIVSESYRAQKHVESAKSKYSDVYNPISYKFIANTSQPLVLSVCNADSCSSVNVN